MRNHRPVHLERLASRRNQKERKMLIQFINHAHKATLKKYPDLRDPRIPLLHLWHHQTGDCPIVESDMTPETIGLGIGPVGVGGVGGSSSMCAECSSVAWTGETGERTVGLLTLTWIEGRRESCGNCRGPSFCSLTGLSYAGASPHSSCS